jgi:hypothetical protein
MLPLKGKPWGKSDGGKEIWLQLVLNLWFGFLGASQ